ncbi:MAG: biotin/lipoyl-containing protein [Burkholderiaceae bacterium]
MLRVDGREHVVNDAGDAGDGMHRLVIAGTALTVTRAEVDDAQVLRLAGRTHRASLASDDDADADGGDNSEVRAPMPGTVVSIEAAAGQAVKRGATLLTIESMKLQTALSAPRDGTVAEILVAAGGVFDKDQVLARLEPDAADGAQGRRPCIGSAR